MFTFTIIEVAAGLIALTMIAVCLYARIWQGVVIGALILLADITSYLSSYGLMPEFVHTIAILLLLVVGVLLMLQSLRQLRRT
ncbi:MAG: hypothetical protein WDZ93_02095 [Candidatus Paceibacterota bacterium]